MLIRKVAIENVRSFLDRREMSFDGLISIIIGPNGGGKTNLLDTVYTMLRRYLFATRYLMQINDGTPQLKWDLRHNDQLNQMVFEKHSSGQALSQTVELTVEVSQSDIDNMLLVKTDAAELRAGSRRLLLSDPWASVHNWDVDAISVGLQFKYVWRDGALQPAESEPARQFLEYLQLYEFDNTMRAEAGKDGLRMSMVYLPVNRSGGGFQSSVALANYNDIEQKRAMDATSSRTGTNIISLAVGRLAQKYRLLQENDNTNAKAAFYADANLIALSADLKDLGYEWELTTVDALTNSYDVTLTKQGSSFLVSAASSGERELLTYLFAIYALNVRDALIIVDEPELHLHPRWQTSLFNLFEKLAKTTGNQFVLATHSPTFISPASIQYVSRIYAEDQKSNIVRLNSAGLPNAKHLFGIVNSQNNESVFFTDKVVLVEGLADRIFFEKVLEIVSKAAGLSRDPALEVVSVGGKGLFAAYEKVLDACGVQHSLIADLDYVEQIGDASLKAMFQVNAQEIKEDVVENIKSLDGEALVARIEEALVSGSWHDAQETWESMESRRRVLKTDLTDAETERLKQFIDGKKNEEIFVLSRGALEAYLPEGHRGKNLDKLIAFVESDGFWEALPPEGRPEIESIAKALLGI